MSSRVAEAQAVLTEFGLPAQQRNEIAAYTLLALANINPDARWADAGRPQLRIHDILRFVAAQHGRQYAENTRETFRRRVLHQFEQARLVDRNPDAPTRPTNSGKTCYALTEEAWQVVRSYGTRRFTGLVKSFLASHPALAATYRAERESHTVAVELPDGAKLVLSAGTHNELQAAVVRHFWPRFLPGAVLLYLGDTAKKNAFLDGPGLAAVGVSHSVHDKLPDLVFHLSDRRWLVLVEAVTSHGPCSPSRRMQLESALGGCPLHRVYVSAFPSFREFKKYVGDIAWDSEVWVAETPDHMIHFNGPKFLGPTA